MEWLDVLRPRLDERLARAIHCAEIERLSHGIDAEQPEAGFAECIAPRPLELFVDHVRQGLCHGGAIQVGRDSCGTHRLHAGRKGRSVQSRRMHGFVAVTDPGWYERLARTPGPKDANFWRPSARAFRLDIGTPFLFKLKAPHNAIAGFGYFAGFLDPPRLARLGHVRRGERGREPRRVLRPADEHLGGGAHPCRSRWSHRLLPDRRGQLLSARILGDAAERLVTADADRGPIRALPW